MVEEISGSTVASQIGFRLQPLVTKILYAFFPFNALPVSVLPLPNTCGFSAPRDSSALLALAAKPVQFRLRVWVVSSVKPRRKAKAQGRLRARVFLGDELSSRGLQVLPKTRSNASRRFKSVPFIQLRAWPATSKLTTSGVWQRGLWL